MKGLLLLIALCLFTNLYPHPGVGLVYDGEKTIYYTDLVHVWKLDTESGQSEIAIENVHTHELCMDSSGYLYGEHYWYDEVNAVFKNYIWKYKPGGKMEIIREEIEGENEDFSFVRDDQFSPLALRDPNIEATWIFRLNDNELAYVMYPGVLVQNQGGIDTLIYPISDWRFPFSIQNDPHKIFGVWAHDGEYYTALYGGRKILNINTEGDINSIYTSSFTWSPINGVFDNDNQLWILEWSLFGDARVKQIEADVHASFALENSLILLIILTVLSLLFWRIKSKKKRPIRSH